MKNTALKTKDNINRKATKNIRSRKKRPQIPDTEIIPVNNAKKLDFSKPYKFIYTQWWYDILVALPFLLAYLVAFVYARKFKLKIIGRENLKVLRRRGCITISNHCHYFDTVFANYVVLPRPLHTSVVQRNFEVPMVRRILRIFRAFPIPSGIRGLDMITSPVGEALKKKHHVHFLPEGNLVLMSQQIHRFYLGAFILSYKHQAPILPITYVLKKKEKAEEHRWDTTNITMVIGKPLQPPSLQNNEIPLGEIEEMADRAASWMEDVLEEHHREI